MSNSPRPARGAGIRGAAIALLLLGAVGEAVLDQGGYRPTQRIVFAGLALATGLLALRHPSAAGRRAARSGAVIALWALGTLGLASALWSIAAPGDGVRWGLVTLGYGATATAAGWLAGRRGGGRALAAGITALAVASALVGLYGAAWHQGPFSDYVRGSWRPGGTVEYSDAMALLAVSGLPGALSAMCARRVVLQALGALAAACLVVALVLDLTRLEMAFAVGLAVWVVWDPRATVRAGRARAAAAVGCLVVMGIVVHLLYGGAMAARATPHPARELAALAGAGLLLAACWVPVAGLLRAGVGSAGPTPRRWAAALLIVCLAAGGGGVALAGRTAPPRYIAHGHAGGFWHGRLHLWRVSVEAALQRPLQGYGADSYLAATLTRQGPFPIRFAHSLPLEVAVELGLPGLLLVVALYGSAARLLWRTRRDGSLWLLGPAAVGFLIASLVDWPWHLAGSGAIWAAALGGLAGRAGPTPADACPPDGRESARSTGAGLSPITERTP